MCPTPWRFRAIGQSGAARRVGPRGSDRFGGAAGRDDRGGSRDVIRVRSEPGGQPPTEYLIVYLVAAPLDCGKRSFRTASTTQPATGEDENWPTTRAVFTLPSELT